MGQLNCAIDSHSTGMWASQQSQCSLCNLCTIITCHLTSPPVLAGLVFCPTGGLTSKVVTVVQGTVDPPSALSYWKMSGCCHLVSGALSPYEIANICHWSLQVLALCQWDNTKTKLLVGVKSNHWGKLLYVRSQKERLVVYATKIKMMSKPMSSFDTCI